MIRQILLILTLLAAIPYALAGKSEFDFSTAEECRTILNTYRIRAADNEANYSGDEFSMAHDLTIFYTTSIRLRDEDPYFLQVCDPIHINKRTPLCHAIINLSCDFVTPEHQKLWSGVVAPLLTRLATYVNAGKYDPDLTGNHAPMRYVIYCQYPADQQGIAKLLPQQCQTKILQGISE